MSDSSSPNKRPTTPPNSEKAVNEASRAYRSTPISQPKPKTKFSSGAHFSETIRSEKLPHIRTSVMAELEDSIHDGGLEFLKAKFPDVAFKMFNEKKDRIRLVNDPNPIPFNPELFAMKSGEEAQPVQPSPESIDEINDDETQPVQPPPDSPSPSIAVTDDIEHESSQPAEPLHRRRSTRLAVGKAQASAAPSAVDPINAILSNLKRKGLYLQSSNKWSKWPENVRGSEGDLASYLNELVDAVRTLLNGGIKPKERDSDWVYSARYANSPVKNEGADRKPDIVIVQRKPKLGLDSSPWGGIRSFGELKSTSTNKREKVIGQLAEYSRLCFGHEKARRFVLCFTLIGDTMQLVKFDRSGVVLSHEFNVHKEPHAFLRIIVGMIIGDDYYLGLDLSFVVEEGKTWVYLNGKRYEFVKNLLLECTNRGRGTVVLLVRRECDKVELVIKDQWVDDSRKLREPDTLKYLKKKDVGSVANIEDYQIVHFEVEGKPVKDSTEYDRSSESGAETRDHFRLLISPYGDKLENFRSLKELVSAFKDYVESMYLYSLLIGTH